MSSATTVNLTGSLTTLITNLVELEGRVHDDLRIYRWRPRVPDLPCMWNWLTGAPFEQRDTGRFRDNIAITATIGIRHTDVDEEMEKLERYADSFRDVIDSALHARHPLGGVWAKRENMRMVPAEFDQLIVLAVEFPILVQMDRMISPS